MRITKLERSPGIWRLRVETRDEFNKRQFSYHKVIGTEDDANAAMQRFLLMKPAQKRKKQTVREYFRSWIDYRVADKQIRPSTGFTYHTNSRPILNLIGHMDIAQLNKDTINELYARLLKTHSPVYVKEMAMIFNRAMKDAVEDDLLENDPTAGVRRPKARRDLKTTTFNTEQIRKLLEVSKDNWFLGPIIRFALATGIRRGEICALQKQDFDLEKGTVFVRRSFAFYEGGFYLGNTKTKTSNRHVTLPEELREEIAERIKGLGSTDFVFTSMEGHRLSPRYLTRAMTLFFKQHGLDEFSMHDLRHAHATYLLQQRMHPKAVSQRLGHADIKTTLSIYSHVLPGDDEILAEKIGRLF